MEKKMERRWNEDGKKNKRMEKKMENIKNIQKTEKHI